MIKYEELKLEEREEISELFATWLKRYTSEVVIRVMARAEEIINNEFAMMLLRELHQRQAEEMRDFERKIESLMTHYDSSKEYECHLYPLTHSSSYRDVLYDMFIKDF